MGSEDSRREMSGGPVYQDADGLVVLWTMLSPVRPAQGTKARFLD